MTTIPFIQHTLGLTGDIFVGLAEDLRDHPMQRACPGGNHAMWLVGHAATSDASFRTMIFGEPNSLEHWGERFNGGTQPLDDASAYPAYGDVIQAFKEDPCRLDRSRRPADRGRPQSALRACHGRLRTHLRHGRQGVGRAVDAQHAPPRPTRRHPPIATARAVDGLKAHPSFKTIGKQPMNKIEPYVRLTRLIRGPREDVYNAWIDPELRKRWWCAYEGMACHVCEIDATEKGAYRCGMTDPQGNGYVAFGEFLELSPFDRIVFTWGWEHDESFGAGSRVTVTLHDAEFEGRPATELVLLHEKLESPLERSDHTTGWLGALKSLGKLFADQAEAKKA